MTRKFLITAAVTAVSTMALAQMGQQSQTQTQERNQGAMQGQTAQPAGGAMQGQTGQMGQMGQSGQQQQLTDDQFVKQAAAASAYEVKSAKLVADKVDDPQVKQHAQRIEQDHKKAADELKQIAKNKDIDFSDEMDAKHQRMYDQLKDQDKQQIAQTWRQQQMQAHRDNIQLFQQASTQLKDPELKQWAQKQLPILQQHQTMLQSSDQSARPAGAQLGEDKKQSGMESKDSPQNP